MDNEGCPGCFDGAKGRQQQLETIRKQAKAYAKERNIAVVIVREPNGFGYYTAGYAASAGLVAIDHISPY